MNQLIDLSQPLFDGCPNCPVHPRVELKLVMQHPHDDWHMESLEMVSHTGSHLDAPLHKIPGGKAIDEIPLDSFAGEALCADLRDSTPNLPIGPDLLAARLQGEIRNRIVLLATGWGQRRAASDEWHYESPFLAPQGAEWLVGQGARAVGIDHYSIGGSQDPGNLRTHETLLGAGLWIVEDLSFPPEVFEVPQPWSFWALPINFKGFSGSFCRPVVARTMPR